MQRWLRDDLFGGFNTTPACDRQTNGQTDEIDVSVQWSAYMCYVDAR